MAGILAHIAISLFHIGDSAALHDTIIVSSRREQWSSVGRFTESFPTNNSAKQSLLLNSSTFIRQYSQGGIATAGRRGADPTQTQVLWNGVPVANSALGITDLNLIQTNLQGLCTLIDGPGSAFNGSGAVGGSINFSNLQSDSGFTLKNQMAVGSFGTFQNNFFSSYRKNYSGIKISQNYLSSKNNFNYLENTPNGIQKNATQNANFESKGINLSAFTNIKKYKIEGIWETGEYFQNIPKTLNGIDQGASQQNKYTRFLMQINRNWSHTFIQLKLAGVKDFLLYRNQSYMNNDTTICKNLYGMVDLIHTLNSKFKLFIQADAQRSIAQVKQYEQTAILLAPATTATLRFQNKKWLSQLGGRFEFREKLFIKTLSTEYFVNTKLKLFGNIGTTFRRPTLNDLYWGGVYRNALKPEFGNYVEGGYKFELPGIQNKLEIKCIQSVFYRKIKDNIRWVPTQLLWQPLNFNTFMAKGIQSNISLRYNFNTKLFVQFKSILDIGNYKVWQQIENKSQPLLVPSINSNTQLMVKISATQFALYHQYIGKRYSNTDNSEAMAAVGLINFSIDHPIKITKKCHLNLRLITNNLLNTNYSILPDRPMPMRNFQLSLQLNYHEK